MGMQDRHQPRAVDRLPHQGQRTFGRVDRAPVVTGVLE
jgi:hypothetical protein